MNILFLGPETGTSRHRILALQRLGHKVYNVNPDRFCPPPPLLSRLDRETGGLLFQERIAKHVLKAIEGVRYEFTWVESGRAVGPRLVKQLRRSGPVVNYNHDDPFGRRDRKAWLLYQKTVPHYDLIVVVREENVAEGYKLGARRVLLRTRIADEIAHSPRALTPEDHERWDTDVLFVGTWMPERGPFLAQLVGRGVPLSILGNRWQRAPEWPVLEAVWRGPGTTNDDDYAKAIQCAKICLGLLSKENRDRHTTRSIEIPALLGLFCAERTDEHLRLYLDGEEAVYWRDAAECAAICHRLLPDEAQRHEIARKGHQRCLDNGHFNEPLLTDIITEATCR